MDSVNGGVQEAFIMEKRIEVEIRALAAAIMQYGRQTDQWLAASHVINTAIKVETFFHSDDYICVYFGNVIALEKSKIKSL